MLSLDLNKMCFLHGVSVLSDIRILWFFLIGLFDLTSYHLKFYWQLKQKDRIL